MPYLLPTRLTGDLYEAGILPELLDDLPLCVRRQVWFKQDLKECATIYVEYTFPNRWRGHFGPVPWHARSPDLTHLDFYLCGHMNSLIYETPVESEMDLVGRIVDGRCIFYEFLIVSGNASAYVRPVLMSMVDILNDYCKFNTAIKSIS